MSKKLGVRQQMYFDITGQKYINKDKYEYAHEVWYFTGFAKDYVRKTEDITPQICSDYLVEKCKQFRSTPSHKRYHALVYLFRKLNDYFSLEFKEEKLRNIIDKPFPCICPTCNIQANLVDSSAIYSSGKYGKRYLCPKCGGHVGTHPGTTIPLGTPANEELQKYRQYVHHFFDDFWEKKGFSRTEAYNWLSEQMELSKKETHIAMFNIFQCKKALAIVGQQSQ